MGIVRQRRKAETRAMLLEAGLSVFAEHGIDLATLDEVARVAGFTKGAISRQFPSKGAFLLPLFEQFAAVARSGTGALSAAWPAYGHDPGGTRYSPAAHLTRDNVARLQIAWVYPTGDYAIGGGGTRFESTPLLVDGTLYVS